MAAFLVCPGAFKGTLSAIDAAAALADGIRRGGPAHTVTVLPMADGGDGTLECLAATGRYQWVDAVARGPLDGAVVNARFLRAGDCAVIESAVACGLVLVDPAARSPLRATSAGVGDLMVAALAAGARGLVVAVGGTASVDGGVGMARALGVRILEGADGRVEAIDRGGLHPLLATASVRAIVDVRSPLLGATGAARVFGPQKGASAEDVAILERRLESLAAAFERELGLDLRSVPGGGAGGGLGAGLRGFCGAAILPGGSWVADTIGLRQRMREVDLVVTGEGRVDGQTLTGKTCQVVTEMAREFNRPVVILAGSLGPGWEGLVSATTRLIDVSGGIARSAAELRNGARRLLETAAAQLAADF